MDRRDAVPARAQLLHASSRAGGTSACRLHRLAAAPDPRGYRRRHAIRAAGLDLPRGAKLDLCRLRQYRHRAGTVFWSEGGGAGGRPRSGRAGWPACAEESGYGGARRTCLYWHFLFCRAVPDHHCRGCGNRVRRKCRRAGVVPGIWRPWAGGEWRRGARRNRRGICSKISRSTFGRHSPVSSRSR